MALVDVLLSDPHRSLRGQVSPLFARAIVAALSANPTTLVELDLALSRFAKRIGERSLLEDFYPIVPELPAGHHTDPHDPLSADTLATNVALTWTADAVPSTGILIDLPARVLVAQGVGFPVEAYGRVTYVDDNPDREVATRFRLSPSWTVLLESFPADKVVQAGGIASEWKRVVAQQRKVRASLLRVDDQAVLYDRLLEFLAEALLSDRFRDSDDLIRDIHAEWLLTARADLFGACPRDLLIGRIEEIDDEMSAREWEWSVLKECPPPLPADSEAVRESGHGIKEYAIYYEMIRYLLAEAWSRLDGRGQFTQATLVDKLRVWRDEWLDRPGYDGLRGCTPRWVIEQERRRVPWVVEEHDQFHDPDCPICRWSKQLDTPSFHQIMVCHEEEGFAFSFCESEKEWNSTIHGFAVEDDDMEDDDMEDDDDTDDDDSDDDRDDDENTGDDVDGPMVRDVSFASVSEMAPPSGPSIATLCPAPPIASPLAYRGTPRPMVSKIQSLEPAQQVTVWHLRLVLLLLDIRDQAGQGDERKLAQESLRGLHEFRDAVRDHEGWLADQYLNEASQQVARIGTRRADLANMCAEFNNELEQMRHASQAALRR
ncbi:MAG: hypothetical protein ACKO38_05135 [Planctomycetota bacterium]